jgi:hypothetical protein
MRNCLHMLHVLRMCASARCRSLWMVHVKGCNSWTAYIRAPCSRSEPHSASVLHLHRCKGVRHQYHGLRQRSRYMYYKQSTHALGCKMSYQDIILCSN